MANKEQLDQIASTLVAAREYRLSIAEFLRREFSDWTLSVTSLDSLRAELADTNVDHSGSTSTTRYGVELAAQFNRVIPPTPFFAFWCRKPLLREAIGDVNVVFAKALKTPFLPFDAFRPNGEMELRRTLLMMLKNPGVCRERRTVFFKSLQDSVPSDTRYWRTRWLCGVREIYILWQIENALQAALEFMPSKVPSFDVAAKHPGLDAVILWAQPPLNKQQMRQSLQRRTQHYAHQGSIPTSHHTNNHSFSGELYDPWFDYYMQADDELLGLIGLMLMSELAGPEPMDSTLDTSAWQDDSAVASNETWVDDRDNGEQTQFSSDDDSSRRSQVDTTVVTDANGDYHSSLGSMS